MTEIDAAFVELISRLADGNLSLSRMSEPGDKVAMVPLPHLARIIALARQSAQGAAPEPVAIAGDIKVHLGSYNMGLRDGSKHPERAKKLLADLGPLMDERDFSKREADEAMQLATARLHAPIPASAPAGQDGIARAIEIVENMLRDWAEPEDNIDRLPYHEFAEKLVAALRTAQEPS